MVQELKRLIKENNLEVVSVAALFSIPQLPHFAAWPLQQDLSGGPIVEVACDMVDLIRFIGGEVDMRTVQSLVTEPDDPAGTVPIIAANGRQIAPDARAPRSVQAMWKHDNGAVGSLHCPSQVSRPR